MAYLTFKEYQELGYTRIDSEDLFKQYEHSAEKQIDITTRYFYNPSLNAHSLTVDQAADVPWVKFRAAQFKEAIALQCDYFDEVGADTPVGIANSDLSNLTIGRTTLAKSSNVGSTNYGKTGLATGVVAILAQIGLLQRAVSYR